jgi:hypothetical protein
MKIHLKGVIAILVMLASPAFAQTAQVVDPGTQSSGAGVPGKAGGKSGPAARRDGTAALDQGNPGTRMQDASAIQGKPGGKSGAAVVPPK